MTHTLHRQGTADSLSRDYIIFAISAQGVNAEGSAEKFRKFAEIVLPYNPVNFGDMKQGNMYMFNLKREEVAAGRDSSPVDNEPMVDYEPILNNFKDNSIMHAVFTDKDAICQCLKKIKEADIGLSIVVSGLIHDVEECCHNVGIKPHTVEYSLGIHGKTEKLPRQEIVDISTMCGHGMVAFSLISYLIDEIKAARITVEEASDELAKQCVCGIFNPKRAAEIIEKLL
jgi:hypothetical protein